MGKMTFVVEYEYGKEPSINAGVDILGGRLTAVAFYDYRDDLLTQDEAQAVNNSIEFTVLRDYCEEFEVDFTKLSLS
ncbi:hypothetical protein [Proteus mirabilis]|uniref:hypothetical protein n=1 Tax=Proteus mirabilis TaxID=584 RepID=UPI001BAB673B|nr:hypothetical protein [Proteus mirabilis]